MESATEQLIISLREVGLEKGFFAGTKGKYNFALLEKMGDYMEIEKKRRHTTVNSCYLWMGKNLNAFKIELRYRDGKCYMVRMS